MPLLMVPAVAVLLALPGVVEEARPAASNPHDDWPAIARVVGEALGKLEAARAQEGRAMAAELKTLRKRFRNKWGGSPTADPWSSRCSRGLHDRISALVQDHGVTVDSKDLIREVAILTDRSDISEEIVRLRAHLVQYLEILEDRESGGRKLEFVVQEMGREVNTIGSKASDVEISRNVFEIKTLLEKIRELIQNVE